MKPKDTFSLVLKDKILVLDGAIGTMIQKFKLKEDDFRGREFLKHPYPLNGFNDILNLSKPSLIKNIHLEYLEAGADIITTNTFSSNNISMKDYGLDVISGLSTRLNKEGVIIAKEAVAEYKNKHFDKKIFIGGSIGPTNRSASMSPDITNPMDRNVSYEDLFNAYKDQIVGLIEGGVDLLICETFFDTLNLKAALSAAENVITERCSNIPILVSATVSDNAGRILSGQTLDAFITSINMFPHVVSIGINCGFGPDRILKFIKSINRINYHFTSCHPNAGLPDEMGCYNLNPEDFGSHLQELIAEREINIVGGCCGTTPAHIKVLSEIVKGGIPRRPIERPALLSLSGLEMFEVKDNFLIVGERCNVAGSAKFLRLIKEGAFEEAAEIAKNQIRNGAEVIDINMDDAMLDSEEEMVRFLRYILAEPDIAKVPFMIDSSKWNVIDVALKQIQGKGIVNSLSLKEGENLFIEKAKKIKDLGFALIVMAFDEKGQADSYERKIEICKRSFDILTKKCGYVPEDIIFDVNVMTIGTGMKEHAKYAIDFIRAVEWIKKNLPGTRTSGGISNLSFAFRGKNKLRDYMHVIFLHHARKAGLDMAIINPVQKSKYEDIPQEIKIAIEDLIFDRNPESLERLLDFANEDIISKKENKVIHSQEASLTIEEILENDLIHGELMGLESHLVTAMEEIKDPVKIIEGPLLSAMQKVGDLFGEGKMFLPQVVKTARSMKRAVEILTPYIEKSRSEFSDKKAGKILIATVKGDVHDIGKNIVSTVLACNNYEIIDLGIMVPSDRIVDVALQEQPDIICLSGLITPSLAEMYETICALNEAGISVPVMIGGAATSPAHTAMKIAPFYRGVVLHMADASQNPIAANLLLNPDKRFSYIEEVNIKNRLIREKIKNKKTILPYSQVLKIVKEEKRNRFDGDKPNIDIDQTLIFDLPLSEIITLINWKMFLNAWNLQGDYTSHFSNNDIETALHEFISTSYGDDRKKAEEALKLYIGATDLLKEIKNDFDGKGVICFKKVKGDEKNIYIDDCVFPMLRQQSAYTDFLSCSDFFGQQSYICFFAVTAGNKMFSLSQEFASKNDTYKSLILQTLADRIAEASAEWLHHYVGKNYWDVKIRPAWGYPMLPDQTMILLTSKILPYEKIGISLTENGAMYPPASISGIFISDPNSKYFMIGEIGEDQIEDYAKRRGITSKRVKEILRQL